MKQLRINKDVEIHQYRYSLGWEMDRAEVGLAIPEEIISEYLRKKVEDIFVVLDNGKVLQAEVIDFLSGNHVEGFWIIPIRWAREVEHDKGEGDNRDNSIGEEQVQEGEPPADYNPVPLHNST